MFARYCSGWLCLSCCEVQGSRGQKGSSARLSSLHEVVCCRNVNAQLKSFRWVFGNSDLVQSWLESLGTFPWALDQELHKFVLFKGGDPGRLNARADSTATCLLDQVMQKDCSESAHEMSQAAPGGINS